ncbi:hypothetical protein HYN56_21970 [Flavobacterium crocinum]|uniref:Peptidase S8 n=1 Tax=Flavobacterium crocinum TaxID=2183896 RepID=A0A2S1YRX9_9FLAO|nr:S8 family serine peptidase [Flavobacterium crocinum]AWK06752.1 hypothetical protein HYN56_21970 [Flavobacterium crocinum]
MKNKLLISICVFLISFLGLRAQEAPYYYYKGKKVNLTVDKGFVNISTEQDVDKSAITALGIKEFELSADKSKNASEKKAKLEFKNDQTDAEFNQRIKKLRENPGIKSVSLYYKRGDAKPIGTSSYFYVKLKDVQDLKLLQKTASEKAVDIVKQVPYMPEWYILSVKKGANGNSVDLSNQFYETGLFADVDPAFMFDFKKTCTNDPDFGSLWGLNNTANPNIDINACQAWTVSQGNGVKIAVVDQGIDKTHNDLAGNISPLSFDAQSGSSPSVFINGNTHGTHVAGTIGAIRDNNLQVVGVAPLSKIMTVSHSLLPTYTISAELASGISWARLNQADVINNSWGDKGGYYYGQLYSAILEQSITQAINEGRNGKGAIVVFASGNYAPVMDYPAYFNDNILTVGAITSVGARSNFSGYGAKLDVVAPGSNILSTIPGNLTLPESGTSMAAPHVAGISALILSVNPNLTGQQVRDIIEQTSQKVGSYSYTTTAGRSNGTWNTEMGYGLVDAYAASLLACMSSLPVITGNDGICTNATYAGPSGATTYNWSVTQGSNLVTLSGNNTSSVTLTRTSQVVNGPITLNLYYGNASCGYRTITKNITVGSNFTVTSSGVGPSGQVDIYIYGGAPPYKIYRGESTLIYTANSAGTYTVPFGCSGGILKVEADTSCGLTAIRKMYGGCSSKLSTQTLADSNSKSNSFLYNVYPNPSSDIINIDLSNKNETENLNIPITATLYDLNGKEQRSISIVDNKGVIDVSKFRKGIYVLHVNINGKTESHQVIIE